MSGPAQSMYGARGPWAVCTTLKSFRFGAMKGARSNVKGKEHGSSILWCVSMTSHLLWLSVRSLVASSSHRTNEQVMLFISRSLRKGLRTDCSQWFSRRGHLPERLRKKANTACRASISSNAGLRGAVFQQSAMPGWASQRQQPSGQVTALLSRCPKLSSHIGSSLHPSPRALWNRGLDAIQPLWRDSGRSAHRRAHHDSHFQEQVTVACRLRMEPDVNASKRGLGLLARLRYHSSSP